MDSSIKLTEVEIRMVEPWLYDLKHLPEYDENDYMRSKDERAAIIINTFFHCCVYEQRGINN